MSDNKSAIWEQEPEEVLRIRLLGGKREVRINYEYTEFHIKIVGERGWKSGRSKRTDEMGRPVFTRGSARPWGLGKVGG